MNANILNRIKELIAYQMDIDEIKVNLDTRLCRDLGMDGADADEFIEKFREEFDVDMSDFPYDSYFGPEAGSIIVEILYYFLFDRSKLWLWRPQVTVRELVAVAKAKRWIPPDDRENHKT